MLTFEAVCRDAGDLTLLRSHVSAAQQNIIRPMQPFDAELQSPREGQTVLPYQHQQQLASTRQQQVSSPSSGAQQNPRRRVPSPAQHNAYKQPKAQKSTVQADYTQNMVASSAKLTQPKTIQPRAFPSSLEVSRCLSQFTQSHDPS